MIRPILYHLAPVLKGLKPANTYMVRKQEAAQLIQILSSLKITCKILYSGQASELCMIYRKALMEDQLNAPENRQFLKEYGIDDFTANGSIEQLKDHIRSYYDKQQIFPHEMGIFLGYPVQDVQGFIENQGKRYLYSGYWKVYVDSIDTKRRFEQFDKAKQELIL